MPVSKRLHLSGPALVFVTTTVREWLPVFADERIALIAVEELRNTGYLQTVAIVAYVVMPSHIHLALGFKDISKLSRFMQTYKSVVSRRVMPLISPAMRVNLTHEGKFRFWMRRFDDLVISSEKQFRIKLEYMHNNPVRAHLVEQAVGWRFSSARDWLTGTKGIIKVDKDYSWLFE